MTAIIVVMVLCLLVSVVVAIRLVNREIDRRNGTEDFWKEIADSMRAARVEEPAAQPRERDESEVDSYAGSSSR